MMREYIAGRLEKEDQDRLIDLIGAISDHGKKEEFKKVYNMSTMHYEHTPLSHQIARALYGSVMQTSVSRFEKFAACAYAHFLNYGLRLYERPEFSFERSDMGDVYHKALEAFSVKMAEEKITWDIIDDKQANEWADDILEKLMSVYGDNILVSSHRNIALSGRIGRVIKRSIDTLKYQITSGDFIPKYFEKNSLKFFIAYPLSPIFFLFFCYIFFFSIYIFYSNVNFFNI